ncbi:hypothetical protein ACFQV2_39565 [Actinokineospora soli]|uniref:Uncharacterized protein n=1 Tax=Actinokineospora soli TaxID=1048753 RepID=A0ABW2U0Q2_9PSEU
MLGIAGPGVFTGLEQETSRSASAWLARGGAVGDVGRRAALVGAGLLALAVAALLVLGDRVFAGQPGLVGPAVVGVVGAALVYLVRGLLAGMRRFTGYAATLAAEGLSRVALVAAVALSGTADATTYALVFALGLVFAAAAGLPWLRPGTPAPDAPRDTASAMARRAGLLVAAGFGVQAVANLAPIIVTGRLTRDTATAAAFAAAFVLVRIPVLLFTTAQVTMLPALTRAAAAATGPRRAGPGGRSGWPSPGSASRPSSSPTPSAARPSGSSSARRCCCPAG